MHRDRDLIRNELQKIGGIDHIFYKQKKGDPMTRASIFFALVFILMMGMQTSSAQSIPRYGLEGLEGWGSERRRPDLAAN